MKGLLKITAILFTIGLVSAFTMDQVANNHGILIEKSITEISKHNFLVTIKVTNGDEVNGLAKYETKLPLSADFIKAKDQDKNVNVKLDGRKVKMVWMHIQRERAYSVSFQISSKKSIDNLKMKGEFFATDNGEKFSFKESSAFTKF
jgi:hypothetical protein